MDSALGRSAAETLLRMPEMVDEAGEGAGAAAGAGVTGATAGAGATGATDVLDVEIPCASAAEARNASAAVASGRKVIGASPETGAVRGGPDDRLFRP